MRDSATVSVGSCKYTWDDIEKRAGILGFDRSKYIQKLVELDLDYKILDDFEKLKFIKEKKKYRLRVIDVVFLLFLLVILLLIMATHLWIG